MIEFVLHGSCKSYDELPKGAAVVWVNGRYSIGQCEACGRPILEGTQYHRYADGMVHKRCG